MVLRVIGMGKCMKNDDEVVEEVLCFFNEVNNFFCLVVFDLDYFFWFFWWYVRFYCYVLEFENLIDFVLLFYNKMCVFFFVLNF